MLVTVILDNLAEGLSREEILRSYPTLVRAHPPEVHAGIVLFRPPAVGRGTTLLFVRRHLASLFERELTSRLLVITDHGIRVR